MDKYYFLHFVSSAGINWHDKELISLVKKIRDSLWMDFEGVYIHEGMCYEKQVEPGGFLFPWGKVLEVNAYIWNV